VTSKSAKDSKKICCNLRNKKLRGRYNDEASL
jgi:hypothetical protein